jgi:hypothetical protein
MKKLSVFSVLLAIVLFAISGGLALAQDQGGGGSPGPQGPPGPAGPPGPSGVTIFGMDQNTALLIGGLILVLIVILAIVSVSNKSGHRA